MTESIVADFVQFIASVLDDKRAEDVTRLDVSDITDLADEFIIATVTSACSISGTPC